MSSLFSSPKESTDLWLDNDNEQDIFNTQLELGKRFVESMRRGNLYKKGKLLMKDGSYYDGEFKNGEIFGNGILFQVNI